MTGFRFPGDARGGPRAEGLLDYVSLTEPTTLFGIKPDPALATRRQQKVVPGK